MLDLLWQPSEIFENRKIVNLMKVVSNNFSLMSVQDQACYGKGVYDMLDIIGYR